MVCVVNYAVSLVFLSQNTDNYVSNSMARGRLVSTSWHDSSEHDLCIVVDVAILPHFLVLVGYYLSSVELLFDAF